VSTEGVFPLAPSFDHVGPMANDVAGCVAMMEVLVPGLTAPEAELGELRAGVAWTADADPLVGERVEAAAALFGRHEAVDLPSATGITALFMREIADVHRDLYDEQGELYGENIRPKIERCLTVSEGDAAESIGARIAYSETMEALFEPFDLLVTPTIAFVAPPADVDEIAIRDRMTSFTFPFNALGWPVLALPCGPAEEGIEASVQLIGRPGEDDRVLAAGLALERALKS
jgi:Asp-tRNA(Asn)/Glu-tRNA(Gln) amidotransferase A subunit family amidase